MNYNFTEKLQRIYFHYRRNYDAHEKLLHIHSKRAGVHLAEDPLIFNLGCFISYIQITL